MKYVLVIIMLVLAGCATNQPSDPLAADMHAQWRYEEVVRSCKAQGKPVYIKRTGTRIRGKLSRHEMLTAACANLN